MTTTSLIQFGQNLPLAPTGVIPIPKGELTVINTDPHNQREKGLIPVPTPQGETMWVHPALSIASSGQLSQAGSPEARLKHPPTMW